MDEDLRARVERLETESALARLAYDYCHGLDRRDYDRFVGIWHDDAVFTTNTPLGTFVGKAEIARGLTEVLWPAVRCSHHWTVNFVVDIEGDRATGLSNLTYQGVAADGTATALAGTYHDEFVRDSGRWLMASREIEIHHAGPLPGVVWQPHAE